jgi:hypothetical protein
MIDPNDLGPGPAQPSPPRRQPARPAPQLGGRPAPEIRYVTAPGTFTLPAVPPWAKKIGLAGTYLFGTFMVMLLVGRILFPPSPTPGPGPRPYDIEARFEGLGRQMAGEFGPDWSAGIREGRKVFAEKKSRQAGEDAIRDRFRKNQLSSFEKIVAPALRDLVAPSKADKDLSDDEWTKLDQAYAGLEKGAEKP